MRLNQALNRTLIVILTLSQLCSSSDLTFRLVPSQILQNPSILPSSTRITLQQYNNTLVAPITRQNTFELRNVSPGSYLLTVQCRDYAFQPLRVDVVTSADGAAQEVEIWRTFWGNEWGNKGERRGGGVWTAGAGPVVTDLQADKLKEYYQERMGFSLFSFLKSPMILMALVSIVMIVGIPYLTENMDEETKAEYEEMQKKGFMGSLGAGPGSKTAQEIQNFDLASWMAGKTTGSGSSGSKSRGGGSTGR